MRGKIGLLNFIKNTQNWTEKLYHRLFSKTIIGQINEIKINKTYTKLCMFIFGKITISK